MLLNHPIIEQLIAVELVGKVSEIAGGLVRVILQKQAAINGTGWWFGCFDDDRQIYFVVGAIFIRCGDGVAERKLGANRIAALRQR